MQFLYQTVKEILDTGRVGVPVFVRCVVQLPPGSGHMINTLARMLILVGSWLKAMPSKIYAQSRYGSTQVTASVQYAGGQTAIVSVISAKRSSPGEDTRHSAENISPRVDLILLGNKGALYHDGIAIPTEPDITFESLPVPRWLISALEHSLQAGKPAIIQEAMDIE